MRDVALKTLNRNPERAACLAMDEFSLQLLDLYKDEDAPDDAQIDSWFQRHKKKTWPRVEDVCKAIQEDATMWCLLYAKGRQYWMKGRYRPSGPGGKTTKPQLKQNQQIKLMYLFHARLTKKAED